jgi:PAS domain S-box-containing protein
MSAVGLSSSLPRTHVHTVQFYSDDGVLLDELDNYIGTALAAGSSAIVIATRGHIDNLDDRLRARGIDLAQAQADGRYIALDATEVLSCFVMDGRVDPARFSATIGRVIGRAAGAARDASRRVVAFGELVALLWAEGQAEAAIQVEKLWNELVKTHSFSLHCAYPMQGFSRLEVADSLSQICAEHSDVSHDEPCADFSPKGDNLRTGARVGKNGKHAAANLLAQHKEEVFRLFVQSVRDYAIFLLDAQGRIASWNLGAERIKGYTASEILGRHFTSFYSKEDVLAGTPQRLLDLATKDGRAQDEGWRVRKDGSRFWASVTITAIRDETGQLIGFGKVTRDLTDRRRAEVALRHAEERWRLFIEAVQDYAIFMLDADGCVSSWNTGAERIKGYKASEIIGQHFSCFYPEEDVRAGKPAWELEVAGREGRFEDEGWRIRKDGSRFWANVIITAVKDNEGRLLGFCKVTRDFTERMLASKSLEESRRKLQESERSLRNLSLHLLRTQDEERRRIGREMHDSLGQYLTVLKMKVDSMSSSAPTPEEITECANLVDECVREVRTISYLLYPPLLEELGLTSAIPWYLEGFSKRSGIETTFHVPEDFGRLSRDAELALFRVLQESLTNVQRHSGSTTADVRISSTDKAVILEVTDQGKGLPPPPLEQGNYQDWMGSFGVGLRGMCERLSQLGGTLEISSNQSGTQVRAVVPFPEPSSADSPSI